MKFSMQALFDEAKIAVVAGSDSDLATREQPAPEMTGC